MSINRRNVGALLKEAAKNSFPLNSALINKIDNIVSLERLPRVLDYRMFRDRFERSVTEVIHDFAGSARIDAVMLEAAARLKESKDATILDYHFQEGARTFVVSYEDANGDVTEMPRCAVLCTIRGRNGRFDDDSEVSRILTMKDDLKFLGPFPYVVVQYPENDCSDVRSWNIYPVAEIATHPRSWVAKIIDFSDLHTEWINGVEQLQTEEMTRVAADGDDYGTFLSPKGVTHNGGSFWQVDDGWATRRNKFCLCRYSPTTLPPYTAVGRFVTVTPGVDVIPRKATRY